MTSKIGIIIGREYTERVKKKSFIISTIITPVLMIVLMMAPAFMMLFTGSGVKEIYVIDDSGIVMPQLKNDDDVHFITTKLNVDSARKDLTDKFGILYIGRDIVNQPSSARLYTNESSSMSIESNINSQLQRIIENEKLKAYKIDNINKILEEVKTPVNVQTFKNDQTKSDEMNATSSEASYFIGMILGLILYMFLFIYGAMVMQSVIEEKNSRVLEIMVSSVRPFDLFMGKIIGVALVAVTQIVIWGILLSLVAAIVLPMCIPENVMTSMAQLNAGNFNAASSSIDVNMLQALSIVTNLWFIVKMFIYLILFLIGGYLLYSAMFAAVGSCVDNPQDAGQLQLPITIPIILSFIVSFSVINDTNSQLAIWFSIIPFTSPIVMMARIPFGVPFWQIVLSLILLYATFIGVVWLAAKIYRVGIFMYGKKPTYKEIYKWMKYK